MHILSCKLLVLQEWVTQTNVWSTTLSETASADENANFVRFLNCAEMIGCLINKENKN